MLPFSFLWLPALSQLTFKGRVYSWPSLWVLGRPSTVWARFSRAMVKALGRLCTLRFLSQSVLAGFAMWASLQDGLAAWLLAQAGSAAALRAFPLALLLPQAHRDLSLLFPSFLQAWHCRVAARSSNRVLCTGAKDGGSLILSWP